MAPGGPGYDMSKPIPGSDAAIGTQRVGRIMISPMICTNGYCMQNQYDQHRPGADMTTGMQSGQAGYYNASGPPADQIPSSAALGASQPGTGQHAMTGKVEHAVGTMIGSKSLKAKGIQKEQ